MRNFSSAPQLFALIQYHIRKMREENILKRVGLIKSGSWKIMEKDDK